MSIEDDKNLYPLIPERLPQFVRVDHPTLVAFLSAYYEWLDLRRDSGLIMSPMALKDVIDIDRTMDQFVERFKKEYLFGFPETLAISKETGNPVDSKNLLKNIKQFYRAKGTEKSYEFLFRILYDTAVEFYYPKTDILKLSSGKWTQNNYLRLSNVLGDQIFRASGNIIVQTDSSGKINATAKVIDVSIYQKGNFTVAELLITARNGTFKTGASGIKFTDGDQTFVEPKIYSVVSSVIITDGGSDYVVGDNVVFTPATGDSGQKARGTVSEVDSSGSIRKINIDDFGINYESAPTVSINTKTGSGFSGTVNIGALCQQAGFYANNDGLLSSNKVIQDNHYYQNWSYVLKSEVVIDRYRDMVRKLVHPIGTAMFGQVQIKRCMKEDIDSSMSLLSYEVPLIGNYMPYTLYTYDNLADWFVDGGDRQGYNPLVHDSSITAGGPYGTGNPISNNYSFAVASETIPDASITGHTGPYHDSPPNELNGDPFWFVYAHPNTKLVGTHIAKIWSDQVRDLREWDEWITRGAGQTAVSEWLNAASLLDKNPINCCSGPENWRHPESFKYALLKYSDQSAFRKVTARSFFEMPMSEEFNCKELKLDDLPLPTAEVTFPLNGQLLTVNSDTVNSSSLFPPSYYRAIEVAYQINNIPSLVRYGVDKVNIKIDEGRQSKTVAVNDAAKVIFDNLQNGRHRLRIVLLDQNGREISGTVKNSMFYYEFVEGTVVDTGSDSIPDAGENEIDTRDPISTTPIIVYGGDTTPYVLNPDPPQSV